MRKKEEGTEGEEKKEEKDDKKEKDSKDTKKEDKKDDKKDKKDEKSKEPKKPKIESVKVDLEVDGTRNDLELLDGESFNSSKAKLDALNQADLDRLAIETALNELQSFSFDLSDKMEDDEEFQSASTSEERESVVAECGKVSEWLDEEAGMFTPVEEFTTKLKVLKDLSAPIMARVREHKERPDALEQLRQSINSSNVFLEKSKAKIVEEEGLFKEKELDSLKKKIAEVEKWRDEKLAEQEKTPLAEMPKLTVSMIKSKIQDLDSEVQFLIQKARMLKAEKEREKRKLEAEEKKAEEERLKKEKKAKKKKAKEANATDTEGEKVAEEVPSTESTGEGDTDTTDKKPEPEIVEEVNEGDNIKDNAEEPSEVPEEHTEL
eukprot:TRINITY_DN2509_c0_g1_i1.p1 TRINITY_DN2509_c0_g1~~TRINITY_DN2509_c0_g1_i1.p1  ORF type:complete len:377 (-),score=189.41 TRINITY_DN2509_c0_g1_i1:168-1298(-)